MLVEGHVARGSSAHRLGHFASARVHFETSIALYDVTVRGGQPTFFDDPKVSALFWLASTLWALGYPDQALVCCAEAEDAAREISHPYCQCNALAGATMVHEFRREPEAIEKYADALIALAAEQGFAFWSKIGAASRSLAVIQQGRGTGQELAQLRGAIETMGATGALDPALWFKGSLAQAHLHLGDIDAALESSQEGLQLTRQYGERWLEALFLRLLGDVLLASSNGVEIEVENFYVESIEVARRQEAKSLELQAALGLARLWSGQGKRKPALELLQPVYDWFTEGRSTPDHVEAAALLAQLR